MNGSALTSGSDHCRCVAALEKHQGLVLPWLMFKPAAQFMQRQDWALRNHVCHKEHEKE